MTGPELGWLGLPGPQLQAPQCPAKRENLKLSARIFGLASGGKIQMEGEQVLADMHNTTGWRSGLDCAKALKPRAYNSTPVRSSALRTGHSRKPGNGADK